MSRRGLVAGDQGGEVGEPADRRRLVHHVAHGRSGLTGDALRQRSAVGIRVDGDGAVLARIGQGHAEQGRDGGLADAALAGEHGHEPGSAVELPLDAGVEVLAGAHARRIASVHGVEGGGVQEAVPAALGRRAGAPVGLDEAVGREHVGRLRALAAVARPCVLGVGLDRLQLRAVVAGSGPHRRLHHDRHGVRRPLRHDAGVDGDARGSRRRPRRRVPPGAGAGGRSTWMLRLSGRAEARSSPACGASSLLYSSPAPRARRARSSSPSSLGGTGASFFVGNSVRA